MRFNFTWIYLLLTVGILAMFYANRGANPQKKEWSDVKQYALAGDVEKIVYIRNEYKGEVQIKADSLQKYSSLFGGRVPSKPPHVVFLVSVILAPVPDTAFTARAVAVAIPERC